MVVKGSDFYLFGGSGIRSAKYNDVWKLTDDGASWEKVSQGGPASETQWAARYNHQAVVKGSDFYLFGGRDRNNNYYNDIWKLTDDGASWKKILKYKTEPARNKETQWAVRYGHQVVVKGSVFYLFGGSGIRSAKYNDVWKSTNDGASWERVSQGGPASETQWAARYNHQVVVKGSDFYLFGGRDRNNNYYNDIWKLTDDGASWKEILKYKTEPARNKETQWAVRYGHQVVVKGSVFYLFGGGGDNPKTGRSTINGTLNDVWVFSKD